MAVTTASMTLAELLELLETNPASEVINGRIDQKPMPQGKHSALQTRLADTIKAVGLQQKTAYTFAELRCTFVERSMFRILLFFSGAGFPLMPMEK